MSERQTYDDGLNESWDHLPLPDENAAWADMKRRLDEDDDRPVIAWWRNGCFLGAMLLLVVGGLAWWIVRPEKWLSSSKENGVNNDTTIAVTQQPIGNLNSNNDTTLRNIIIEEEVAKEEGDSNVKTPVVIDTIREIVDSPPTKIPVAATGRKDKTKLDKNVVTISETGAKRSSPRIKGRPKGTNTDVPVNGLKNSTNVKEQPKKELEGNSKTDDRVRDTVITTEDKKTITIDDTALVKKPPVSPMKNDSAKVEIATKTRTKDSTGKKPIFFSAGIAEQQQIPLAGQQLTPYNAQGRKGSLSDYIPSVYFRINKQDRWFTQIEFKYGAPQYTKDIEYSQRITPDTGTNPRFSTINSSIVKKTFYHQLPVTFNAFITPNWSFGGGLVWNRFSSAVTEKQVRRRDVGSPNDSTLSKVLVQERGDSASAFARSYFQAVVESQYQLHRFSFGARYSFGLQPYLEFTLPGGTSQKERNSSLIIFIRYQLWRSKK